ncbi:MAG: FecR domain-containing protein, partial [Bacteroidota bacterium]
MISREYIDQLILRLLEGEDLDRDEQDNLINWLKKHPEEHKSLSEQIGVWINMDTEQEVSKELIDEQWEKFHDKIISKSDNLKTHKSKIKILPILSRYAAIFILGILLTSVSSYLYRNFFDNNYTVQTIEVPYGAKSSIKLTDGSEVILNAGSRLEYTSLFGNRTREVKLEGEAYFKVSKNPQKPFIVNASGLTVKAYGTEFNVKSYAEDKSIQATLIKGRIGVQKTISGDNKETQEFFLKPMEQVILHKAIKTQGDSASIISEKLFIARKINPDLYTAWIKDKIHVKSETLKELALRLERKYNVQINIEDKELENKKFTGILENETIEQVLQVLELSA